MTWKRGINIFKSQFNKPVPLKIPSHHNLSQLFCPQHHQLWKHPALFPMQNGKKSFSSTASSECSALMAALSSTAIPWTLRWYTQMAARVPLLSNGASSGFWTAAHTSFQLSATTSAPRERVTVCAL